MIYTISIEGDNMLKFDDFNLFSEFEENWNKKIHSLRIIGFIVAILMIISAFFCIVYPVRSVTVVGTIASSIILVLGIYQVIDYLATIPLFRWPGSLVNAICNLLIGFLLIRSPIEITISMFAFIFGFILMVNGVNKLSFALRLRFLGIESYSWVIFTGIVNVAAAIVFIIAPMMSTLVLNYIIAAYLLVGGIVLLIEMIEMKDLII